MGDQEQSSTVEGIMNHEVYSVGAEDGCGEVLGMILTLGITAAPVVDAHGVPLGLVSLRNLAKAQRDDPVSKHMTSPAATVSPQTPVAQAAREMGQLSYHHLVVVGEDGKLVGFVSSLDAIRGLVSLPSRHPPAFAQTEPESGLSWTGTLALSAQNVERMAFDGPGMLVITHAATPDDVVWAEASKQVRERLLSFVTGEHNLPERVRERLGEGELAFRAASFSGQSTGGPSVIDVLLGR